MKLEREGRGQGSLGVFGGGGGGVGRPLVVYCVGRMTVFLAKQN